MLGAGWRVGQTQPPSVITISALTLETCFCPHFSTSHTSPTATSVLSERSLLLDLHCEDSLSSPFSVSKPLAPDSHFQLPWSGTENKKVGPGMSLFPISEGLFPLPPLTSATILGSRWILEWQCHEGRSAPKTKSKPTHPQSKRVEGYAAALVLLQA